VTKRQSQHLSTGRARTVDYEPLVRAAAAGDQAAVEHLLMRAQEVAFRFSLLVCGHAEDAEDVMQEALLKTYRFVGRIKRPEGFRTWLYRTVRNACLMKRRRRVNEPAHLVSLESGGRDGDGSPTELEVEDRGRQPDEAVMNRWLGRRLRSALAALPPTYRMVLILREIEGLSTREVASITKVSEANVKTRLHRARVMLRERLGDV
jgi:RNA polymerase sigma-70 factor (ECF subfamily)